jgi:hypothetical protein
MSGPLESVYGTNNLMIFINFRELLSFGKVPYFGMKNGEVIKELLDGYRLQIPESCPEEIYQLMLNCWDKNPANRMTFEQISEKVDKWVMESNQETQTIMQSSYFVEPEPVVYN